MTEALLSAKESIINRISPEPVELPINGVLDLHTFRPADVEDLVPTYLEECRRRGILQVRVIHGKGTGALLVELKREN